MNLCIRDVGSLVVVHDMDNHRDFLQNGLCREVLKLDETINFCVTFCLPMDALGIICDLIS